MAGIDNFKIYNEIRSEFPDIVLEFRRNNNAVRVLILDEEGPGGAYHQYELVDANDRTKVFGKISFQNGPIRESGVNGLSIEDLLDVCAHRLERFQMGAYNHPQNAKALEHIYSAILALYDRTKERIQRGVEGASGV
jgi:hypothetical protein